MSRLIKINEYIERNKSLGENDIFRKFSKQFEKLFNAKESTKTKKILKVFMLKIQNLKRKLKILLKQKLIRYVFVSAIPELESRLLSGIVLDLGWKMEHI